jgi:hypothetical protein
VSGSNNTFSINCGIGKEQGAALLKIVNKILANQLDTNTVMAKIDELVQVVKSIAHDRVMSAERLKLFTSALGTAPGGLAAVLAGSGDDGFPLARQICDAAKQEGWGPTICPNSSHSEMGAEDVEGLKCYSMNWSSPASVAFKKAMEAGDLSCTYIPHSYSGNGATINPTLITILIGRPQKLPN